MSSNFHAGIWRERLQAFVIRCSNYLLAREVLWIVYAAVLVRVIALVRFIPEVRSLYLKIPKDRAYCFGSSDLDLVATTATLDWPAVSALRDRLVDYLLPAGSWRRIIDLHLFSEQEFNLKSLVESSASRARRIRIFGSQAGFLRESNSTERLKGLLYEYFQICERVFARRHTPHEIRIVGRTVLKIHEELVLLESNVDCDEHATPLDVLSRSAQLARGIGIHRATFTELAHMLQLANTELSAISNKSLANRDSTQGKLHLTNAFARPITMDEFVSQCRLELGRLFCEFQDVIASALAGGTPGCDFDYRIYIVLHDGASRARVTSFSEALRQVFTSTSLLSSKLWRIRCPIVLTFSVWKKSSKWYHALRPLEETYFIQRHGEVLTGQDLRQPSGEPCAGDLFLSAAQSVCDLRNIMWESIRHHQTSRLADLLLGRIPVLWLILSKGIVATTRGEALSECAKLDFPNFARLEELNRCLCGLPPDDLPAASSSIWEPSLVESCELISSMVETAHCRIN